MESRPVAFPQLLETGGNKQREATDRKVGSLTYKTGIEPRTTDHLGKSNTLSYATTQRKLEDVMVSKISPLQDRGCITPLTGGDYGSQTHRSRM